MQIKWPDMTSKNRMQHKLAWSLNLIQEIISECRSVMREVGNMTPSEVGRVKSRKNSKTQSGQG